MLSRIYFEDIFVNTFSCCSSPSQPQSLRADAAGAEGKEVAQGESLPSRRRDWAPYSPPYPVASEPLRNSLSVLK